MKSLLLISTFWLFLLPVITWADVGQLRYVKASKTGLYYMVMVPRQLSEKEGQLVVDWPSFGRAYKLQKDGTSKDLWSVNWYASKVYISDDGDYLVRLGEWHEGDEASSSDLGLAFYKKGVEIASYSTKDLLLESETVKLAMGHYDWLDFSDGLPQLFVFNQFQIKLVSGRVMSFDIKTGKIISAGAEPI